MCAFASSSKLISDALVVTLRVVAVMGGPKSRQQTAQLLPGLSIFIIFLGEEAQQRIGQMWTLELRGSL